MTSLINKDKPLRDRIMFGLLALFFLFIVQVLATIISLIAVFQFFATLVTGKANKKLQLFSRSMADYFKQIIMFVAYIDEYKPWPFSAWPANEEDEDLVEEVEIVDDPKDEEEKKDTGENG
jgi:hypothetical protein